MTPALEPTSTQERGKASNMSSYVMTVTGPRSPSELGVVLPHEHVFMAMLEEYRPDPGLLFDVELQSRELRYLLDAGCRTVVDATSIGLGREPEKLASVARALDMNIIMGAGYYRDPYLSEEFFDLHSVDEIADGIVHEFEHGVGDTGIKPGIIGEIGCNRWYLSAREERSFRAAARASVRTGLAVTTHATRWPVGLDQHRILVQEGMDAERIIVGHCDTVPDTDYHLEVAERGSYVEFDTIRGKTEYEVERRVHFIKNMINHGFVDQVLLSQDICLTSYLHVWGGCGYDYLLREFVPHLLEEGVDQSDIDRMLIDNPQRVLTVVDSAGGSDDA